MTGRVLLAGVLPPARVGGQTQQTIALSFDDGQPTPSAVTGVSEGGGAQTVRVAAAAPPDAGRFLR